MDLSSLGFLDAARHLQSGELSSMELVRALLDRMEHTAGRLNAFAHIYRRRAESWAAASDARRAKGAPLSRYDGVPFSVKESVHIEGQETTLGLPALKGRIAEQSAVVVQLMEEAGCVLLGKTNVSQAMLFHESRNPLFGQSVHPLDPRRTPGGSSGGEACAIAAGLSPGGFGTDIGGSIRVPAPSPRLLMRSEVGLRPAMPQKCAGIPGQEVIRSQLGPMARTVRDLRALLDVVSPMACAQKDPRVAPLPLDAAGTLSPKKLRVGMFVDDGVVTPSQAVQRATTRAAKALEEAGCEVVPFDPPITDELIFLYFAALSSDGAETLRENLDPKDADVALTLLLKLIAMPRRPRQAAGLGLTLVGERVAGRVLEALGEKSVAELWKLTARARQMQAEIFDHWAHHRLDAVICPPHATPALLHETSRDFSVGGALAFRYNLIDFPAGVVPVTTVRESETVRLVREQRHEKVAAEIDAGSAGLPVGVQVVARPHREDVALLVMELIETHVASDDEFPQTPFRDQPAEA